MQVVYVGSSGKVFCMTGTHVTRRTLLGLGSSFDVFDSSVRSVSGGDRGETHPHSSLRCLPLSPTTVPSDVDEQGEREETDGEISGVGRVPHPRRSPLPGTLRALGLDDPVGKKGETLTEKRRVSHLREPKRTLRNESVTCVFGQGTVSGVRLCFDIKNSRGQTGFKSVSRRIATVKME